ncbi:hypothetical protein EDB85DRAFT_986167 [Lactarius pseudohatsudake]|nr:hypothetical protein EDB85DRAFT_986167 [Lactarius pseudohatsudake]
MISLRVAPKRKFRAITQCRAFLLAVTSLVAYKTLERLKNRRGTGQKEDVDPSKITFAANIPTKQIAGRKRVRDVHVWDQSLSSCQSLIATVSLARSLVEFPNLVLKRGKGGIVTGRCGKVHSWSAIGTISRQRKLSLRKSSGT